MTTTEACAHTEVLQLQRLLISHGSSRGGYTFHFGQFLRCFIWHQLYPLGLPLLLLADRPALKTYSFLRVVEPDLLLFNVLPSSLAVLITVLAAVDPTDYALLPTELPVLWCVTTLRNMVLSIKYAWTPAAVHGRLFELPHAEQNVYQHTTTFTSSWLTPPLAVLQRELEISALRHQINVDELTLRVPPKVVHHAQALLLPLRKLLAEDSAEQRPPGLPALRIKVGQATAPLDAAARGWPIPLRVLATGIHVAAQPAAAGPVMLAALVLAIVVITLPFILSAGSAAVRNVVIRGTLASVGVRIAISYATLMQSFVLFGFLLICAFDARRRQLIARLVSRIIFPLSEHDAALWFGQAEPSSAAPAERDTEQQSRASLFGSFNPMANDSTSAANGEREGGWLAPGRQFMARSGAGRLQLSPPMVDITQDDSAFVWYSLRQLLLGAGLNFKLRLDTFLSGAGAAAAFLVVFLLLRLFVSHDLRTASSDVLAGEIHSIVTGTLFTVSFLASTAATIMAGSEVNESSAAQEAIFADAAVDVEASAHHAARSSLAMGPRLAGLSSAKLRQRPSPFLVEQMGHAEEAGAHFTRVASSLRTIQRAIRVHEEAHPAKVLGVRASPLLLRVMGTSLATLAGVISSWLSMG